MALAVGAVAGGAPACAQTQNEVPFTHPDDVPAPEVTKSFDAALLQATGVALAEGHEVELVNNGALFDRMVELIGRARRSVHVVVFIWRPGEPSNRILEALANRREGVACRVVVDPLGATGSFEEEVQPKLAQLGCDARLYRPVTKVEHRERLARNHRKLVIVDGEWGLTGGFGIHESWLGDGVSGEEQWRETNALIRGPAVREMQLAFAEDWQEVGGGLLPEETLPEPSKLEKRSKGDARAAFSKSSPGPGGTAADKLTQLVIASAKERLWISNAYFVPSEAILQLLEEKRREGVDVRVLAAGPVHDWKVVLEAQRAAYPRLLEAGIRIWEYQPSMMHAKTVLVDDRLSVIGSTNLDPLSLNRLEEGSIVVDDRKLAEDLAKTFERDLGYAKEIRESDLETPTPWRRISRHLTRMLGRWP